MIVALSSRGMAGRNRHRRDGGHVVHGGQRKPEGERCLCLDSFPGRAALLKADAWGVVAFSFSFSCGVATRLELAQVSLFYGGESCRW